MISEAEDEQPCTQGWASHLRRSLTQSAPTGIVIPKKIPINVISDDSSSSPDADIRAGSAADRRRTLTTVSTF